MKIKKSLSGGLGTCLGLFSFAGCNFGGGQSSEHVHEYTFYTAKEATCEESGILEAVCSTCGVKEYKEIQAKGHTFINGSCSVCGELKGNAPAPDENVTKDFSAFYSFDDLYEQSELLQFTLTREEFMAELDNMTLSDLYVNKSGDLKLTFNGELVFNFGEVRKDFKMQTSSLPPTIYRLVVESGMMKITHVNGTLEEVGKIDAFSELSTTDGIVGIAVNLENQLLVRLKNDAVYSLGKLAEDQTEIDDGTLIYSLSEGKYRVYGAMNQGTESVDIPFTHLGKTVEGIVYNAFSECKSLKSVTIAEGLTSVSARAFADCTALTEITLPVSVKVIDSNAFAGCSALKTVRYAGTAAQWAEIFVRSGNEYLLTAQVVCNG